MRYLIEQGIEIAVVVAPPKEELTHWLPRLIDTAQCYGIPTATDDELYDYLEGAGGRRDFGFRLDDIDLVISFLFRKRIKKPLIGLGKIGCINFHPAPLPEFRGYVGYNLGIYEGASSWGVSAHFVDETFDTGDLIKVTSFDISPERETAFSLEQKSQPFLLELFKDVIDIAHKTGQLPRKPQGAGRHFTKQDFENLRKIHPGDTLDEIERKIRAFWYPPYEGASVEIQGKEFTLVNQDILKEIGTKYHK